MTVEKLSLRIPARLSLPPEDLPWTEDGPHLQGNLKTTFIQIQSNRDPLPSHPYAESSNNLRHVSDTQNHQHEEILETH